MSLLRIEPGISLLHVRLVANELTLSMLLIWILKKTVLTKLDIFKRSIIVGIILVSEFLSSKNAHDRHIEISESRHFKILKFWWPWNA
jgi:hypothetical protein